MNRKIFIMGAPNAGKSTYLAALWHSVIQTEMPIKFKLKRMEKDTQYLYSLEKKWFGVEHYRLTGFGM